MRELFRIYRQMLVIVLFAFAADLLARDTLTPVPLPRPRPPMAFCERWLANYCIWPPDPDSVTHGILVWPRAGDDLCMLSRCRRPIGDFPGTENRLPPAY